MNQTGNFEHLNLNPIVQAQDFAFTSSCYCLYMQIPDKRPTSTIINSFVYWDEWVLGEDMKRDRCSESGIASLTPHSFSRVFMAPESKFLLYQSAFFQVGP